MSITNYSENLNFHEQVVSYLANISQSTNPDERAKFDAVIKSTNKYEQAKKAAPNDGIGIGHSEFMIINQLINQNLKWNNSAVEKTINQQADRIEKHSSSLINFHQQGVYKLLSDYHEEQCQRVSRFESVVTDQETFQFKLLEQYEELKEEIKQLKNVYQPKHKPMDSTRELFPGPDQDSNGCLDGSVLVDKIREENKNKLIEEQSKILKDIKENAKKNDINTGSTLHNKARDGDMHKRQNNSNKPAPNATKIPGSPESARNKIKNNPTKSHVPSYDPGDNEYAEFKRVTYPITERVPILENDPDTGHQSVRVEEQQYEEDDDFQDFNPSKSAKKRMRKRRTNDAKRARCEVVIHKIRETIFEEDSKLFYVSEANKFLQWTWDELSPEHLGEEIGIDLEMCDIVKTSRIHVWTGLHDEDNPLPMVVQFKEESTANEVKRAMYAAGCYERRIRRKTGKYGKTGDKKKDKEIDETLAYLPYGRPSSTKAERDIARKKKEYKTGPTFQHKTTYQEFKRERDVDFTQLSKKYTIGTKDGVKALVKKPKTISNKKPENGQIEGDEIEDEEYYNPDWFEGDYCRVKCAFDGLVHEAKLLEQDLDNPLVFKILILGYGHKEKINCSLFKKSKGKKAQNAQIVALAKNPIVEEKEGSKTDEEKVSNEADKLPIHEKVNPLNQSLEDLREVVEDELKANEESDNSLLRDDNEENNIIENIEESPIKTTDIIDINDAADIIDNSVTLSEEETYNEDFCGFKTINEEEQKTGIGYDALKELLKSKDDSFEFALSEGEDELKTPEKLKSKPTLKNIDIFNTVTRSRSSHRQNEFPKPLLRSSSVNTKGIKK